MSSVTGQSQAHGFQRENEIRELVFELPNVKNDTNTHDIPRESNKFNSQENVSIKVSGNNNIDCGDILRFYKTPLTDDSINTIILSRYKQDGEYKKYTEIIEINHTKELHDYLFGNIPLELLEAYVKRIKCIPPGRATCSSEYRKEKNDLQKQYDMKINICPKVDSKKQRRVQCSIPNIDVLFAKTDFQTPIVISRTSEPIIRGIRISDAILSAKRKRKIKIEESSRESILHDEVPFCN
jgi:hypothetical protein